MPEVLVDVLIDALQSYRSQKKQSRPHDLAVVTGAGSNHHGG